MGYARKATLQDAFTLAPKLRKEDIAEIRATIGEEPDNALVFAFFASEDCYAICDGNGAVIGMFGVSRTGADEGSIWMVASDELRRHGLEFLRKCREWIAAFNAKYPLLFGYTDCRNTLHHKWLKWCGFTFINKAPFGVEGRPFYAFVRIT